MTLNDNYAPKISVLVPIYNVEKYLRQCIDSIINQTFKDIEIILLNDGSTDSCPQICDEYAIKDSRIKVIHKPNSGYGATMNVGLDKARGKYIGIVESDDWIEPEMFAFLYSQIENSNCDFVKEKHYIYDTKSEKSFVNKAFVDNELLNKIIKPTDFENVFMSAPSIWAAIYCSDFLKKNNIRFNETPGASYQDTSFWFKVLIASQKALFADNCHLHYRSNNANQSVNDKRKIFCICDEFEHIEAYMNEHNIHDENIRNIIQKQKIYKYMWNLRRLEKNGRKIFVESKGKELQKIFEKYCKDSDLIKGNKQHFNRYYVYRNSPQISVIIQADKIGDIKDTLTYFTAQTLENIEILCFYTFLSKEQKQIVKSFVKKDSRIKLIKYDSFINKFFLNQKIRGEYIFIYNDIDLNYDLCEDLYNKADKIDLDILYCSRKEIVKRHKYANLSQQEDIYNYFHELDTQNYFVLYNNYFLHRNKLAYKTTYIGIKDLFLLKSYLRARKVVIWQNDVFKNKENCKLPNETKGWFLQYTRYALNLIKDIRDIFGKKANKYENLIVDKVEREYNKFSNIDKNKCKYIYRDFLNKLLPFSCVNYRLFSFIPLLRKEKQGDIVIYKIMKCSILKIYTSSKTTKIYFCGVPVMKIIKD